MFLPVVNEIVQWPQPRFIASPSRDGTSIDRLPSLPLARGLHRSRIAFVAQASVIPGEAARGNDPADDWFRLASEFLVINIKEAIRRQNAPPMIGKPLVATEVLDQLGTSGRERKAQMKMSLMDR